MGIRREPWEHLVPAGWPVSRGDAKIFNITADGIQVATGYLSMGGRCGFIQGLTDDQANGW
jgi:hypothetical protein